MSRGPRRIARAIVFGALATSVLGGCAGFAPQGSPGATDTGAIGCQVGPQPGATVRDGDPLAAGEPMAGVDVAAMTPRQVGELARSRGLKVTWRYDYALATGVGPGGPPLSGSTPGINPAPNGSPGADGSAGPAASSSPAAASVKPGGIAAGVGVSGFSECWCEPPPDGRVTGVAYGMASELVVFVDSGRTLTVPRSQPSRGWGC